MTKKTRREKEVAELRRQLEVLKAQAKSYQTRQPASAETAEAPEIRKTETPIRIRRVDPKFIKKDLLKTLGLTILALALIAIAALIL